MNRNYGWIPDLPDQRDYKYADIKPTLDLPKSVDLRSQCSDVEDQGELGSCTSNALVGNLEYLEKVKTNLSRLFVYYNERAIEGTVDEDSGAYLRDGIKCLNKNGVCSERLWPYRIERFAKKPSIWAYFIAMFHKIKSYHAINGLQEMKTCLAEGYPFVFGFTVYESFESDKVAKTGVVPMPKPSEQILGGHAVMAVGYDDATKRFLLRNSWGNEWGQDGYFTMPYTYLANPDLADDFWTIRK